MPALRALAAVLALAPVCVQAQMYKCVDERGVTTYLDKPRPGCKGGEVNIRSNPPAVGNVPREGEDMRQRELDFRRRQIERSEAAATQKAERDKELAARREACAELKNDLLTLDSRSRIVLDVNSKGERTYMDDATRARTLAETREKLRACE